MEVGEAGPADGVPAPAVAPGPGPPPTGGRPGRATVRLRFSKLGKVRFTSHRDVARMWERALRRGGLPVAYSEGFSPRPLLSFGLALPTGCESLAEYLDLRLDVPDGAPPGDLEAAVRHAGLGGYLPEGVTLQAVGAVAPGTGSLQQEVTSCTWEMEVLGSAGEELAERVERLLGASSVPIGRERKGRQVQDDLRPSVLTLSPVPGPGDAAASSPPVGWLRAEVATQPRGLRPHELVQGLGGDLALLRARRTHQWIERNGIRSEPLCIGDRPPEEAACRPPRRAT